MTLSDLRGGAAAAASVSRPRARRLPDQIAIEGHLHDCPPCARELRELHDGRHALRLAAAPAPPDDWTGLAVGRRSAGCAPRRTSRGRARVRRAVRRHAPGLDRAWPRRPRRSSVAATCSRCCTSRRRSAQDSLAAMIAVDGCAVGFRSESRRSLDGRIQAPERARGRPRLRGARALGDRTAN